MKFYINIILLVLCTLCSAQGDLINPATDSNEIIGFYNKVRTQFEGTTTIDEQVNFLQIPKQVSTLFPLRSCPNLDQPQELTVMFFYQRNYDTIFDDSIEGDNYQFFSFGDRIQCYFTGDTSIECDTPERHRLIVSYERNVKALWLHFTMSISEKGTAYIQIRNGIELIAEDYSENFYFEQREKQLELCMGHCVDDYRSHDNGFTGNIREVFVKNHYFPYKSLGSDDINILQTYRFDVLGYYRLKDDNNEFNFRTITVQKLGQNSFPSFPSFGFQKLPVDVCPTTFLTRDLVSFSGGLNQQQIQKHKILSDSAVRQKDYAYTTSMTIYVDRNTCTERRADKASQSCHLILLDQVFMLYFESQNMARMHFYAQKNYYESQTPRFFIPFNQWVTLQISMNQFDGYHLVLLDQDGISLLSMYRRFNMREQRPTGELQLLTGFQGFISRFLINDQRVKLPTPNYLIRSPWINTSFYMREFNGLEVIDSGSSSGLSLTQISKIVNFPYQVYEYGQPRTDAETNREHYDGIACDDRHLTLRTDNKRSDIDFRLEHIDAENKQQSSIQFWMRLEDKSFYSPSSLNQYVEVPIFELEQKSTRLVYWSVFLRDFFEQENGAYRNLRELVISPFGRQRTSNEIVVTFNNFNALNEDASGWWHLSCSFQKEVSVQCILHNTLITVEKSIQIEEQKFLEIPLGDYTGIFYNQIDRMYLKGFRFYTRALEQTEVEKTRYNNGDYEDLIYQTNLNEWTSYLVQDYKSTERLGYNPATRSMVPVTTKFYHAICPAYTYYKNGYCYKEPVNEMYVTVFPYYSQDQNQLMWRLTVEHSNLISNDVLQKLSVEYFTNDLALESLFKSELAYNKANNITKPDLDIPSTMLRQEDLYNVKAVITDGNFEVFQDLNFIPSKCHWFNVESSNSFTAYRVYDKMPGEQEITFFLNLRKNPDVQCTRFYNFYNKFDVEAFNFKFMIDTDQDSYMINQPFVSWVPVYDNEQLMSISLTISTTEQYKLPVWTDIKILMDIQWTSELLGESKLPGIFQNAIYKFKLEPKNAKINANVTPNTPQVSRGQTLVLSANQTTVLGVDPVFVQQQMSYKWLCPLLFFSICEQQQGASDLYIPYDFLQQNATQFNYDYTFQVEASWKKPSGEVDSQRAQTLIRWYNGMQMPKFKIICNPIDIDSTGNTFCKIEGDGFNAESAIKAYNTKWMVAPKIENSMQYRDGEYFTFNPQDLIEDTSYTIMVNVTMKDYPEVNNVFKYQFDSGLKTSSLGRGLSRSLQDQSIRSVNHQLDYYEDLDQKALDQFTLDLFADQLLAAYTKPEETSDALQAFSVLNARAKDAGLSIESLLPVLDLASEISPSSNDLILAKVMELPYTDSYTRDSFSATSAKFNRYSALDGDRTIVEAAGVRYVLDAADLYSQMPIQEAPEDFYLQLIVQKSHPSVFIRIIDSLDDQSLSIGDYDGNAQISFPLTSMAPESLCQARINQEWQTDLCLTELDVQMQLLNCTCNMMLADLISVNTMIVLDEPDLGVAFQREVGAVTENFEESETIQEEEEDPGVSYLLITVVVITTMYQIVGTYFANLLDSVDIDKAKRPIKYKEWEMALLKDVSEHFNEPLEIVKLRSKQIIAYEATDQSPLFYILRAEHPLLSPFSVYNPVKPRRVRFQAFQVLVNLWILICFSLHNSQIVPEAITVHLIENDLLQLHTIWFCGSLFLLPCLSSLIVWTLQNYEQDGKPVPASYWTDIMRSTLTILNFMLVVLQVSTAVVLVLSTPYFSQMVVALSIIGSFLVAFTSNFFRVLANWLLPDRLSCFTTKQARQIRRDIQAVKGLNTIVKTIREQEQAKQVFELRQEPLQTERPLQQETEQDQDLEDQMYSELDYKNKVDELEEPTIVEQADGNIYSHQE